MNRRLPRSHPQASIVLMVALTLFGCQSRTATHEEHEEEHHTGPHGGTLVELSDEAIQGAGIVVGTAESREIEVVLELPGELKLNAERAVDVRPTYPGRLVELHATLGSRVSRGQTLAVIYSNESLSNYVVAAPMSGTVVSRSVNPGAAVDHETVLCTVADLSSVWLEFPVYMQDLGRIHRGQKVSLRTEAGPVESAVGTVDYVGPLLDSNTRTSYARVVLPNRDGRWQPGRLVTALAVVERVTVPVAVPEDALVRLGTGVAVFRADSSGFEVQPVTTGRSDGTTTEIVSGLERGARVVSKNAFWLKAELEKEAGGHED
jgi:cobalt-zinc-cadmium efflux system membrane fusion protein